MLLKIYVTMDFIMYLAHSSNKYFDLPFIKIIILIIIHCQNVYITSCVVGFNNPMALLIRIKVNLNNMLNLEISNPRHMKIEFKVVVKQVY